MNKFSIGQKVRIIGTGNYHWGGTLISKDFPDRIGIIQEIQEIREDNLYSVVNLKGSNLWNFREKDLEPYEEERFNWANPTFTVGQDLKKGEKVEITQEGFILPVLTEEKMLEITKDCLRYCIHRIRNHPACGLKLRAKDIEKVLEELK